MKIRYPAERSNRGKESGKKQFYDWMFFFFFFPSCVTKAGAMASAKVPAHWVSKVISLKNHFQLMCATDSICKFMMMQQAFISERSI